MRVLAAIRLPGVAAGGIRTHLGLRPYRCTPIGIRREFAGKDLNLHWQIQSLLACRLADPRVNPSVAGEGAGRQADKVDRRRDIYQM